MISKVEMDLTRRFQAPVKDGERAIATLHDAALLYQEQSSATIKEKAWQVLFEHIARAGHHGGLWIDLCEIALRQAINGSRKRVFDPNVTKLNWRPRRKRNDPWR
jgi:hypothetical protein